MEKKMNNSLITIDQITQMPEFRNLPSQIQDDLTKYFLTKKIDISAEQVKMMLEHCSSDHDIDSYLKFQDLQNSIQSQNKGINVNYTSFETHTPTGRISSKTTHSTASAGCLIQTCLICFMTVLLMVVIL